VIAVACPPSGKPFPDTHWEEGTPAWQPKPTHPGVSRHALTVQTGDRDHAGEKNPPDHPPHASVPSSRAEPNSVQHGAAPKQTKKTYTGFPVVLVFFELPTRQAEAEPVLENTLTPAPSVTPSTMPQPSFPPAFVGVYVLFYC